MVSFRWFRSAHVTVPEATGINHVCFALDNFDADGVFGSNACHFVAQAEDRLTSLLLLLLLLRYCRFRTAVSRKT
jgi:hypothetical protein